MAKQRAPVTTTRYQVFVSSTFTDLRDERRQVQLALLQMDCIPAGMELFPAADEEQFEFIKRVIDDCDYYILLIAARYGSLAPEGISYTEKEFDYAVNSGLPVLAFLHDDPESRPFRQSEGDPGAREKLEQFRQEVETGRLVKKWTTPQELPGLVALSLNATMKVHPGKGWVRGPLVDTTGLLQQLNVVRQENAELVGRLSKVKGQFGIEPATLAQSDELIKLSGTSLHGAWVKEVSWNGILFAIGPSLYGWEAEETVGGLLAAAVTKLNRGAMNPAVNEDILSTVRIQLAALGYIEAKSMTSVANVPYLYWRLTEAGHRAVTSLRAIRTSSNPQC